MTSSLPEVDPKVISAQLMETNSNTKEVSEQLWLALWGGDGGVFAAHVKHTNPNALVHYGTCQDSPLLHNVLTMSHLAGRLDNKGDSRSEDPEDHKFVEEQKAIMKAAILDHPGFTPSIKFRSRRRNLTLWHTIIEQQEWEIFRECFRRGFDPTKELCMNDKTVAEFCEQKADFKRLIVLYSDYKPVLWKPHTHSHFIPGFKRVVHYLLWLNRTTAIASELQPVCKDKNNRFWKLPKPLLMRVMTFAAHGLRLRFFMNQSCE